MCITVSLDTGADPPVTVSPPQYDVGSGNQTIDWVPSQASPSTFTFVGVAFLSRKRPFTSVGFSTNRKQMSVSENNDSPGTDYPYVIMVNAGGIDYCSVPSSGIIRNGGTPKIHNN